MKYNCVRNYSGNLVKIWHFSLDSHYFFMDILKRFFGNSLANMAANRLKLLLKKWILYFFQYSNIRKYVLLLNLLHMTRDSRTLGMSPNYQDPING